MGGNTMKRDTRTAYRARAAATERSIDAALTEVKAAEEVERAERATAYAAKHDPIPFSDEQLKAARAIRTDIGWHKVARVNTKTISVETGYSWTDKIAIEKVLEVR
jgi:hypothetical protein